MSDYGTPEERAAALAVCEACKALNTAIFHANFIGVNVKIVDLSEEDWDAHSNLIVQRMERRTLILPTALGTSENDHSAKQNGG